jgi:hypothetical protein
VIMSTLSTDEDGKQLSEMHGTIRRSGNITSGLCIVGSYRWMIWCSGVYLPMKVQISSPPLGGFFSGDTSLPT